VRPHTRNASHPPHPPHLSPCTGPHVDGVVLRVITERLANATEPDELLALSADLVAIAGVVAEQAMCDAPATSC
jgi:hypothetical protein